MRRVLGARYRLREKNSRPNQIRTSPEQLGRSAIPPSSDLPWKWQILRDGAGCSNALSRRKPGSNLGSGIRSLPANSPLLGWLGGQLVANCGWPRLLATQSAPHRAGFLPPLALKIVRSQALPVKRGWRVAAWNEGRAEPPAAGETVGDMPSVRRHETPTMIAPIGKVAA